MKKNIYWGHSTLFPTPVNLVHFKSSFHDSGRREVATLFKGSSHVELELQIQRSRREKKASRRNESKMRSIFLAAPVGIGVVVKRIFREVNPRFCEITGYDKKELIGHNTRMLYLSDEEYERVGLEECSLPGMVGTTSVETRFKRKDGKIIEVLMRATPFDWEDLSPGVTFTAIDITEQKAAEATLRKSEQAFRSLFDDHAAVKLIIDPDTGRIIAANHAAELFYGWPRAKMSQMNIRQINTKPPDEIKKSMEDAKDQKRIHFDFQHRLADGSVRDVEVFSSGVEIDGHKYIHSIVHDITEQKRVKKEMEELQAQNWRLKKTESLSRMAGAIAHHFNNHLMGIMGNLELCLQVIRRDESPEKYLTKAMKVVEKAADVSELIMTYLGQNTFGKTPIDLSEVCRISMPLLKAALPVNILLEADFPTHAPMVFGNANQIRQLFINLVTNAAESYGGKGTVHLAVKSVRAGEIPERYRFPIDWRPGHDEYVCLEVTDSGCGINDQDVEKIFDPFFSTKFTGRGLGLAVVLGIVKANNGVIVVNSKWGEGSSFRFFVPGMTEPNSHRPD